MSRRDEIRGVLDATLPDKLGSPIQSLSSEYTEQYRMHAEVGGKTLTVLVTKYPGDENPESFDGQERWGIEFIDSEGRALHRFLNPESSLEDVLGSVDWRRIRVILEV